MPVNGQNELQNRTTMKGKPKPEIGQKNLLGMSLADTLDQHVTPYPTFRIEGGRHDCIFCATQSTGALWMSSSRRFTLRTGARRFGSCLVDRGYRSRKSVGETQLLFPEDRKIEGSAYLRRKRKWHFDRRSAVESIIGHLKSRFGLDRCMIEGPVGASINLKMAAAA